MVRPSAYEAAAVVSKACLGVLDRALDRTAASTMAKEAAEAAAALSTGGIARVARAAARAAQRQRGVGAGNGKERRPF